MELTTVSKHESYNTIYHDPKKHTNPTHIPFSLQPFPVHAILYNLKYLCTIQVRNSCRSSYIRLWFFSTQKPFPFDQATYYYILPKNEDTIQCVHDSTVLHWKVFVLHGNLSAVRKLSHIFCDVCVWWRAHKIPLYIGTTKGLKNHPLNHVEHSGAL